MSNSEPLMDKIEAKGEGTDDEKKMHRDGTEAEKSLNEGRPVGGHHPQPDYPRACGSRCKPIGTKYARHSPGDLV